MATKLIKVVILSFSIFFNLLAQSQSVESVSLSDIFIDTISLNNSRYEFKDFGVLISENNWTEEYDDYSRNYKESTFDSLVILSFTTNSKKLYINWIKVTGSNHKVIINKIGFNVGDSIVMLTKVYPALNDEYLKYVLKNQRPNSMAYFGIPLKIMTNTKTPIYFYGSVKFGIIEGHIKEILIDLRPDGDNE